MDSIDQILKAQGLQIEDEDRARLQAMQGRNLSTLLLMQEKTGGDSKEMKAVKKAISKIEVQLSREKSGAFTVDQVDYLLGMYDEAILKALNSEKELARRDELTGIKNKTAYSELEHSVQRNIDDGMDYLPFAIAVCDVNDLKRTNDTEGHKSGDELLKASAKLLCDVFSHSPVFRIDGDEFVIFLRGDDYTSRQELMLRLRRQVRDNQSSGQGPVIASGMSEYISGQDLKVSEVFERADNIMYADKRSLKENPYG